MTDEQKKELEITADEDGEFWMSYQDFITYFGRLDICNVSPHSLLDDKRKDYFWDRKFYDGAWVKDKSAGGCRNFIDSYHLNPQFVVELKNKDDTDEEKRCSLLIALMQKNGRTKIEGSHYLPIGFAIYRLQENQVDQVPMNNDFFRYNRSVEQSIFINARGVTGRYKLPAGHYLIVPSTFHPNEEAEFLLRVCYEKDEFFDHAAFEKYVAESKDKKETHDFTPVSTVK